jgi:hypothetical protein
MSRMLGDLREGSSDRLKYYLPSAFTGAAMPPMIYAPWR